MSVVSYHFPTPIRFGAGAIAEVPKTLREQGLERPLVVTDKSLAGLKICQDLMADLKTNGLIPELFDGIEGNPTVSQVNAGTKALHTHGADTIVAFGGGAAMDVAKIIGLMAHHPGDVMDYVDEGQGIRDVDQPIPYIVAIPTTAGTGSEVGRAAVVSDDATKAKKIVFHPRLLPPLVVADPELTLKLPAGITAATGFDALTHNAEAYLSLGFHPMADGIALQAIEMIVEYLPIAVERGDDLDARSQMLIAALMGAVAFQKGLGVTHSCAHALSTVYDLHHGMANALMLEACMEFNGKIVPERLAAMGRAAGYRGDDTAAAGEHFLQTIRDLKRRCGLPSGLKELGVTDVAPLLPVALADPCHTENPGPVSEADFRKLYEASL